MQIHNLKREHKNIKTAQVGRGGKRGKTSGRGTKGQKARAGHKIRPESRDVIKRLPKMRGYSFGSRMEKAFPINLDTLEIKFAKGGDVNPEVLMKMGIIESMGDKIPKVKILGRGEITKKFNISGCLISATAKSAIEKAGGSIK